jgi:hypothetical protein
VTFSEISLHELCMCGEHGSICGTGRQTFFYLSMTCELPKLLLRKMSLRGKGNQNIKQGLRKFMEDISLIERSCWVFTSSEVLNSNLIPETGYHDRFHDFLSPSVTFWDSHVPQNSMRPVLFTLSYPWILRSQYSLKERHEIKDLHHFQFFFQILFTSSRIFRHSTIRLREMCSW